jgi:small subunit ribosomal protein S15
MAKTKQQIIAEVAINKNDTGSSDVQVALLTKRILELTEHLTLHPKDLHSKRGLLLMVGRRRKLLRYLQTHAPARYENLVKKLGLRK